MFTVPARFAQFAKPNYDSFVDFIDKNRQHQKEALIALKDQTLGQVTIPTGTGKTRIQVAAHMNDMTKKTALGQSGVYVIAAHRLALCNQLLNDLIEVVSDCKLMFDVLFIGSDRVDADEIMNKYDLNNYVSRINFTLSQDQVLDAYKLAKNSNRHLLIVSTYHSFDKLKLLPKIDIVTYDEAHTTIGEDFSKNIAEVKPIVEKNLFFTATRKIVNEDFGMADEELYGKVLFERSPKEMVKAGEIVPPRFHTIDVTEDYTHIDDEKLQNNAMRLKSIIEGFKKHLIQVSKAISPEFPERLGAKLLISAEGTDSLEQVYFQPAFKEWCERNNIKAYAFSSVIGDYANFVKTDRDSVIEEMQALPDSQDAILIHIDILTEGIDLPSITGIMPFRNLNKIKLLQTLGRAARLLKSDRNRLYSGVIQPCQKERMVKPVSWIILPRYFHDSENIKRMKEIVRLIRDTYGVPVEEIAIDDDYLSHEDETPERITERDKGKKRPEIVDLRHIIEDIMMEEIDAELEDLDPESTRIKRIRHAFEELPNEVFETKSILHSADVEEITTPTEEEIMDQYDPSLETLSEIFTDIEREKDEPNSEMSTTQTFALRVFPALLRVFKSESERKAV